jgi:peptide/nickel transport system permease protein
LSRKKAVDSTKSNSELRVTLRILSSSRITLAGLVIVASFVLISLFVWLTKASILPYNPNEIIVSQILRPPSLAHPFGTDSLGRDIFTRIIAASPVDAEVAFSVVGIAFVLGAIIGMIAGYIGGVVEEVIMRITDVFLAFPAIVLALAIVAALGPSIPNTILALAPVWWPSYTRLARGETIAVKSQDFVEAARATGQRSRSIVLRNIFPNIFPLLLVYVTLDVGTVILIFSVLSYIGLGAQPPAAEWGLMAVQGEQYLSSNPWVPIVPALVILVVAIGFSLLGDGLRDAFDPKTRGLFD